MITVAWDVVENMRETFLTCLTTFSDKIHNISFISVLCRKCSVFLFPQSFCTFDLTGVSVDPVQEAEEAESPKRSIRDSGYIDCWDSERSDSLSPPRHGREDSFDSLDSFGSRSRQTPSPDVLVARGSSDGGTWRRPHTPGSLKFTHNTISVDQIDRESCGQNDDPLKMKKKTRLAGLICSVIVSL